MRVEDELNKAKVNLDRVVNGFVKLQTVEKAVIVCVVSPEINNNCVTLETESLLYNLLHLFKNNKEKGLLT